MNTYYKIFMLIKIIINGRIKVYFLVVSVVTNDSRNFFGLKSRLTVKRLTY